MNSVFFQMNTWLSIALTLFCVSCGGNEDDDASDDDEADDDSMDDDADDFGLNWLSLPGGEFSMGCAANDPACLENEKPNHPVTLAAFAITATKITQGQYRDLMNNSPSYNADCADCPVEQVTWFEATRFCETAGGRLPTEAEWEYAARAGAETIYYCGGSATCLVDAAWYLDDADGVSHPVGLKAPNDFGLYDALGNVWEWVADWYSADGYHDSPAANPVGPANGASRVLRGGAFNNDATFLRLSFRNYDQPDDRSRAAGFRCARDIANDESF